MTSYPLTRFSIPNNLIDYCSKPELAGRNGLETISSDRINISSVILDLQNRDLLQRFAVPKWRQSREETQARQLYFYGAGSNCCVFWHCRATSIGSATDTRRKKRTGKNCIWLLYTFYAALPIVHMVGGSLDCRSSSHILSIFWNVFVSCLWQLQRESQWVRVHFPFSNRAEGSRVGGKQKVWRTLGLLRNTLRACLLISFRRARQ